MEKYIYILLIAIIPIIANGQDSLTTNQDTVLLLKQKDKEVIAHISQCVEQSIPKREANTKFDLRIWLPTFTALFILLVTNLVTLHKIKKETSESIKKEIITAKVKIERERLEKFYDPIFTTLSSNSSIFKAYGPKSFPKDSGVLETEASIVWTEIVKNVIIPNNLKIGNIIQQYSHLINGSDNLDIYLEYLVHSESYKHFIDMPNTIHKAFKYPVDFISNVKINRDEIIKRLNETEQKLLI